MIEGERGKDRGKEREKDSERERKRKSDRAKKRQRARERDIREKTEENLQGASRTLGWDASWWIQRRSDPVVGSDAS